MLPLQWLTPVLPFDGDESTTALNHDKIHQTFLDLQQKTKETLYSIDGAQNEDQGSSGVSSNTTYQDKSPKGSVDAPIQDFVDLINHHSDVCSLSSCSGRISLFDPNPSDSKPTISSPTSSTAEAAASARATDERVDSTPFTEESGKGRGTWVKVSHTIVDPEDVLDCIFSERAKEEHPDENTQPWILKFEPMLLHIAASSLPVGQALLQLALECGFRESGLVVTATRVTVAIRKQGLHLAFPLHPFPEHSLYPSRQYVRAVLEDCNERFYTNWKHLSRLYQAMETKWFQVSREPARIQAKLFPLPQLRLWDTAVAITKEGSQSHSILAFGGYGWGPGSSRKSQRHGDIYQLDYNRETWTQEWKRITPTSTTPKDPSVWKPLFGSPSLQFVESLPKCQGIASAKVGPWILLWGGRMSPTAPLAGNSLYLYHPENQELARWILPEQGPTPEPRWGHSLVELSGNRLLLVGGTQLTMSADDNGNPRPETKALEDIWVLHYLEGASNGHPFQWECLGNISLAGGRMHATATVIPNAQDPKYAKDPTETVVVIGGLSKATQQNPLRFFSQVPVVRNGDAASSGIWACEIGQTISGGKDISTYSAQVDNPDISGGQGLRVFGADCCSVLGRNVMLLSGGLQQPPQAGEEGYESPIQAFVAQSLDQFRRNANKKLLLSPISLPIELGQLPEPQEAVDPHDIRPSFASLVHHRSVALTDSEFVLVGGGVPSFAFGESFAPSYHVRITQTDMISESAKPSQSTEPGSGITSSAQASTTSNQRTPQVQVVYVEPKHAKLVKTALQGLKWLNKDYRMTKLQPATPMVDEIPTDDRSLERLHRIAIPIVSSPPIWTALQDRLAQAEAPNPDSEGSWETYVLGIGEESMPPSTATFAASKPGSKIKK